MCLFHFPSFLCGWIKGFQVSTLRCPVKDAGEGRDCSDPALTLGLSKVLSTPDSHFPVGFQALLFAPHTSSLSNQLTRQLAAFFSEVPTHHLSRSILLRNLQMEVQTTSKVFKALHNLLPQISTLQAPYILDVFPSLIYLLASWDPQECLGSTSGTFAWILVHPAWVIIRREAS